MIHVYIEQEEAGEDCSFAEAAEHFEYVFFFQFEGEEGEEVEEAAFEEVILQQVQFLIQYVVDSLKEGVEDSFQEEVEQLIYFGWIIFLIKAIKFAELKLFL